MYTCNRHGGSDENEKPSERGIEAIFQQCVVHCSAYGSTWKKRHERNIRRKADRKAVSITPRANGTMMPTIDTAPAFLA